MTQFVVYVNDNSKSKERYPFLLDIQSNFLNELSTTVVVPLSPKSQAADFAMTRLNPEVTIDRRKFYILTQDMAGINRSSLKSKVRDLSHYRTEITAALDFLFYGF